MRKEVKYRKKTKTIRWVKMFAKRWVLKFTKDEYNVCKENLNVIYDEIANWIKIRSRCNWYELGEKI